MSQPPPTNSFEQDKDTNYSEMLPTNVFKVLNILTDTLKWNPDYCILPMVVTAAGAIGNARETNIAGYTVRAILYGCSVGNPSVNKSEPLKFAVKPLWEAFEAMYAEYKELHEEWEASPDKTGKQEPKLSEIIFSDITIEKVAVSLMNNPKGGLLAADELKGWFGTFQRYNNGNAEQTYLELFSCTPLTVSRMTRKTVHVRAPHLSIIGTTQDDVIHRTFKDAANNGLKERLLFVHPDAKPQAWSREATKDQYNEALEAWRAIINPLFNLRGEPVNIPMDAAAKVVLFDWQENNTRRKISNPDAAAMLGKADIICPRLALILCLMDNPKATKIRETDTIRAVNLMEYFIQHGQKVMQVIKEGEPSRPGAKQMLFASLGDEFTTQEAVIKGAELNISERTTKRYLNDTAFCRGVKMGLYEKV